MSDKEYKDLFKSGWPQEDLVSCNSGLWDKVYKTDSKYTKKQTHGARLTSVSPQYQAKLATEQFGPYGKGWGLRNIKHDFETLGDKGVVLISALFFYILGGVRVEFEINNAWPFKFGERVDPDFMKKAETNTISKALSKLGFNADVFMGDFDDPEYMQERQRESAIEHAADKDAEKAKQAQDLRADAFKVISQIESSQSMNELEGLYKSMARRIGQRDPGLLRKLESAKDKAKDRLGGESK